MYIRMEGRNLFIRGELTTYKYLGLNKYNVRKGAWKMRETSHEECSTGMGSVKSKYKQTRNPGDNP
jgi:hypothetical protein